MSSKTISQNSEKRLTGVHASIKKDGSTFFRASITYQGKHIALGNYKSEFVAHKAYLEARKILDNNDITLSDYSHVLVLSFSKYVSLINFRDNKFYISTPIILKKGYFLYYLSNRDVYTFDIDDLFYYSSHTIQKRGSHLFVADYGSQISIMTRYGIPPYAVAGRDYIFINGDSTDLRYANIQIINRYRGVRLFTEKGFQKYKVIIHVKSNFVVGVYDSEIEAAIAYNKAADLLIKQGITKKFEPNYIEDLRPMDYADIYTRIKISPKIINWKG